jgi:uncharacterized protein DUF6644
VTPIEAGFAWVEDTSLSMWVRGESMYAFPLILSAHTLGMGFLAGTSAGIDLRLLGIANRVPLSALAKFYPVMWLALALNFASGTLLLIGYPYKAFTNPLFYVKLTLIAAAVYLVVRIRREVLLQAEPAESILRHGRLLAMVSLACWIGVIAAGRLLAYTYSWLLVGMPNNF